MHAGQPLGGLLEPDADERSGRDLVGKPGAARAQPLHAGVLVALVDDPGTGVEVPAVAHAERRQRLAQLVVAVLGERRAVALEVGQALADDLAALTARAGHHGDGTTGGCPGREQRAGRERLVVGVRVHRDEAAGRRHAEVRRAWSGP